MAVKFDKILGQLREKDTTAAADSIKGIVDYYADLPTVGSHTGEFWLVRYASGTWIISRKPAGLYYSNGLTWAAAPDIIPFFDDDNFRIYDNVDNTRVLKFESSTIATGTTRTLTAPNASGKIIISEGVAGGQTINGGTLTTEELTLQANSANTTTGRIHIATTTTATDEKTGALCVDGGFGLAGAMYIKNTLTVDDSYYLKTPNISMKAGLNMFVKNPSNVNIADFDYLTGALSVYGTGTSPALTNMRINTWDTVNGYIQNNILNLSNGASASSDWIATGNIGTDSTYYIDMGWNNSAWADPTFTIKGANSGYLYTMSGDLAIGTASATKVLTFFTGGTLAANSRGSFSDTAFNTSVPVKAIYTGTSTSYSLFGDLTSSSIGTDVMQVGKVVSSSGGAGRCMIVVAETNVAGTETAAIQALNAVAQTLNTCAGNLTSSSSGGGLRSRYGASHKGTGTVTLATALQSFIQAGDTTSGNSSVITTARTFDSASPTMQGTAPSIGTFTSYYVTGGALAVGTITNRYGLYIENLIGGTNRYGIYQAGATDLNYFAGKVGVGLSLPTANLHVGTTEFALSADAAQFVGARSLYTSLEGLYTGQLSIVDNTSMAAGVGGAISFHGSYTGTSPTWLASIAGVKSNGTNGNYAGDLVFNTRVNAGNNTEKMRIGSTGNATIGSYEVLSVIITAACSADGNVDVTLRGAAPVSIAVTTADNTTALVATAIAAGVYTGWVASRVGSTVTFTNTTLGVKTGANTFAPNSTGVTATAGITVSVMGGTYTHKLNISGAVQIGDAFVYTPGSLGLDFVMGNATGNSRFLFGQGNSTYGGMIWVYNATAASAYLKIFGSNALRDDLIISQATGYIGLGTSAPVSALEVRSGLTTVGSVITLATKETSTVAGDVLGEIKFYAPLDAAGGDAILTGASIQALATATFSATVNSTDLVFKTGASEAATEKARITSGGFLGIGTTAPTNILSLGGNSARTIWMERHTTANTAGNDLTVQGGGATSGATDKDGGMAVIQPGLSTGTGKGSTRIKRLTRAGATGTTDNTLVDGMVIMAEKSITAEGSVNLFEVALPAGGMCAGSVSFQILATDGTDFQSHSCNVNYAAVNKAGVYTSQIVEAPIAGSADANSTGVAITDTWAITSGTNKVTISVSVTCASIVANDIKLYYTVHNGGRNAITQL